MKLKSAGQNTFYRKTPLEIMAEIRIVVVEDEAATARNLIHILHETDENISVIKTLHVVADAVEWFRDYPAAYDLVFMDIRLADGLSFFKQTTISREKTNFS